jgi:hypothetical protein
MKAKKALKRLNKVETLLSNVIDQCPASARGLRELVVERARRSCLVFFAFGESMSRYAKGLGDGYMPWLDLATK